jgi:hypothetical protein
MVRLIHTRAVILNFLALLSLELANKAVITRFLNNKYEQRKSQNNNKIIFYSHNLHLYAKRFVSSRQQWRQLITPTNMPNYPSGYN